MRDKNRLSLLHILLGRASELLPERPVEGAHRTESAFENAELGAVLPLPQERNDVFQPEKIDVTQNAETDAGFEQPRNITRVVSEMPGNRRERDLFLVVFVNVEKDLGDQIRPCVGRPVLERDVPGDDADGWHRFTMRITE